MQDLKYFVDLPAGLSESQAKESAMPGKLQLLKVRASQRLSVSTVILSYNCEAYGSCGHDKCNDLPLCAQMPIAYVLGDSKGLV